MSSAPIEISCPHCMRVYRLRVDLRTLASTRSTARCGRCGRRFSLTKRVHDSGVMTSPLVPAAREVAPGLRPSVPPAATKPLTPRFRDTDPTGPPAALRRAAGASSAPDAVERRRRMSTTPPEPRGERVADERPLRSASLAEPLAGSGLPPDFASEPPRESEPLVAALRRSRTQPQLADLIERGQPPPTSQSLADAFPADDGWREQALADAAQRLRASPPRVSMAATSDPLGQLARPMPVGVDGGDGLTPLDSDGEDLTPVPSEASASEWALDPDEWVARADPGLDALSAAHSEAAEALRWLLLDDRVSR